VGYLIITPQSRVFFEKLIVSQLVTKYPAFDENQRFFVVFTTATH
jgi:hypothetical protein